jgi:hypothetical protein
MAQRGRPRIHDVQQGKAAALVGASEIQEMFDFWKKVMNKTKTVLLDAKRSRRIGWAIKSYGTDISKQAILGCSYSDWHMGKNPNGKNYNDISLIFRDAEHVEMFLERYDKHMVKSARESWIDEDPE